MKEQTLEDSFRSYGYEKLYGEDLVKFDKKYDQIILNLLGRTVVVEDMDTAIVLAKQNKYSFRIVTVKGDLINPSGAITGGSVAQKTVNILGRAREIEDFIKEEQIEVKEQQLVTPTRTGFTVVEWGGTEIK